MSQKPDKVNIHQTIGFKLPDNTYTFKNNQTVLYALGIGFSSDPLLLKDLDFTYEISENFKVFPTFATSFLDISYVHEAMLTCPGLPEFNGLQMLHGMHGLTLYRPLKKEGTYYQRSIIEDIQDKEKGALAVLRTDAYEDPEYKILALTNRMFLFVRGIGRFDPQKTHQPIVKLEMRPIPDSDPTFTVEQATTKNQALLFRLNGDFNPLHADPAMAEFAGFPKPIIHGLCTYGIITKLVMDCISNYEVDAVEKVHTKFISHLFPGETIVVKGWFNKKENAVIFEASCKERNKVIAQGLVILKKELKPKL